MLLALRNTQLIVSVDLLECHTRMYEMVREELAICDPNEEPFHHLRNRIHVISRLARYLTVGFRQIVEQGLSDPARGSSNSCLDGEIMC